LYRAPLGLATSVSRFAEALDGDEGKAATASLR
jgi:hypothetical protein